MKVLSIKEIKKSPEKDMLFLGFELLIEAIIFTVSTFIFEGKIKNEVLFEASLSISGFIIPYMYVGHKEFFAGLKEKRNSIKTMKLMFFFFIIFVLNFFVSEITNLVLYGIFNFIPHGHKNETSLSVQLVLYSAFIAPVFEELLYRGVVLRHLEKYGGVFAVIISSVLFSLMHQNIAQIPVSFAGGIVMGYIAYMYSFKWAAVIHILNNFTIELSYLLSNKKELYGTAFDYTLLCLSILFIIFYILKNIVDIRKNIASIHMRYQKYKWSIRQKEKINGFKLFFTTISFIILIIYHAVFTVLSAIQFK